ncbi:hypothetical protein [Actinoplanes sp. G11-F43]|uniref:hypothetical protein n=1 Tax=Actinoplanes sp. G11-F43 TaxID=3424130 RepID=UPI003D3553E1
MNELPDEAAGRVIDPVGQTAEDVAILVRGVPGVQGLHSGLFGEVATYLAGHRVAGVRVGPGRIEVHVVLDGNVPIRMTAERIHAVVHAATRLPVHVVVEDVAA